MNTCKLSYKKQGMGVVLFDRLRPSHGTAFRDKGQARDGSELFKKISTQVGTKGQSGKGTKREKARPLCAYVPMCL